MLSVQRTTLESDNCRLVVVESVSKLSDRMRFFLILPYRCSCLNIMNIVKLRDQIKVQCELKCLPFEMEIF